MQLRQLIYLCITTCASVATIITQTPYWAGKSAALHGTETWQMLLLCLGFLISAGGFIYGTWALMGEHGGTVPVEANYTNILRDGFGPDGSQKPYESISAWLQRTDSALAEYRTIISQKAFKIRILNKIVLSAVGCAVIGAVAIFTNTLLDNYVKQQAETICTQSSASKEAGSTFGSNNSNGIRQRYGDQQKSD